MSRLLVLPRFRLRLIVFCITILFSFGVAFPGQYWIARGTTKDDRSFSRRHDINVKRGLSNGGTSLPSSNIVDNFNRQPPRNKKSQSESLKVRGGEEPVVASEKEIIRKYIESLGSSTTTLDSFHVHGWRWHTRSLIREVGRLHKLALKTTIPNVNRLQEATEYVVDFNLRGLHKIETDVFFPWMREQLTSLPKDKVVSEAFSTVMTELERDREKISMLGKNIQQNADVAGDARNSRQLRSHAIDAVAEQSLELQECARGMMELEDTYLVPVIASIVSEKEQKSFNNKVLRGLGLFDSRLHLVSMYEAVSEDTNCLKETELFQKEIPSVPQMMIPRWKRKLYAPKTYMLE